MLITVEYWIETDQNQSDLFRKALPIDCLTKVLKGNKLGSTQNAWIERKPSPRLPKELRIDCFHFSQLKSKLEYKKHYSSGVLFKVRY